MIDIFIYLGWMILISIITIVFALLSLFVDYSLDAKKQAQKKGKEGKWQDYCRYGIKKLYYALSQFIWIKKVILFFKPTSNMSNNRPDKGVCNSICEHRNDEFFSRGIGISKQPSNHLKGIIKRGTTKSK